MILASFLGSLYVRNLPRGLRASLVFEQSYSGVDGDSASCAELCALLSSLAVAPIKQSLPAGERGTEGNYPEASLNGRVEATLVRFARDLQAFEKPAEDEDKGKTIDA